MRRRAKVRTGQGVPLVVLALIAVALITAGAIVAGS